jgi:hypothetical protein
MIKNVSRALFGSLILSQCHYPRRDIHPSSTTQLVRLERKEEKPVDSLESLRRVLGYIERARS